MSDRARKIWDGCINNDAALILRGISLKENVDSLGSGGKTPLIYSCAMGQEESIRALLTANPDPFIRDTIKNKSAMDYLQGLRDRRFDNKQAMIDALQAYIDNFSLEEPSYTVNYMEFRQLVTKEPSPNEVSFHVANSQTAKLMPSLPSLRNEVKVTKKANSDEGARNTVTQVLYIVEDAVTFREGGALHGIIYNHDLVGDHLQAYLDKFSTGIIEKLGIVENLLLSVTSLNNQGIVLMCLDTHHLYRGQGFPQWKVGGLEFAAFTGSSVQDLFLRKEGMHSYAPEVIRSLMTKETYYVSPAMDVWSLGLLAFKILTEMDLFEALELNSSDEVEGFLAQEESGVQEGVDAVLSSFELPSVISQLLSSLLRANPTERPSLDSFQGTFLSSFLNRQDEEEEEGRRGEKRERLIEEDSLEEQEEYREVERPSSSPSSSSSLDWNRLQAVLSSSLRQEFLSLHRDVESQLRGVHEQLDSLSSQQREEGRGGEQGEQGGRKEEERNERGMTAKEMDGLLAESQVELQRVLRDTVRSSLHSSLHGPLEGLLTRLFEEERERQEHQQQQQGHEQGGNFLSEETVERLTESVAQKITATLPRLIARVVPNHEKDFETQAYAIQELQDAVSGLRREGREREEKEGEKEVRLLQSVEAVVDTKMNAVIQNQESLAAKQESMITNLLQPMWAVMAAQEKKREERRQQKREEMLNNSNNNDNDNDSSINSSGLLTLDNSKRKSRLASEGTSTPSSRSSSRSSTPTTSSRTPSPSKISRKELLYPDREYTTTSTATTATRDWDADVLHERKQTTRVNETDATIKERPVSQTFEVPLDSLLNEQVTQDTQRPRRKRPEHRAPSPQQRSTQDLHEDDGFVLVDSHLDEETRKPVHADGIMSTFRAMRVARKLKDKTERKRSTSATLTRRTGKERLERALSKERLQRSGAPTRKIKKKTTTRTRTGEEEEEEEGTRKRSISSKKKRSSSSSARLKSSSRTRTEQQDAPPSAIKYQNKAVPYSSIYQVVSK